MTKFFNKFKNPCFWSIFGPFSQFWEQKIFSRKALSRKFIYDTIPRKQPDRCKDGRMEGWAERRTDLLPSGDQKSDGNS